MAKKKDEPGDPGPHVGAALSALPPGTLTFIKLEDAANGMFLHASFHPFGGLSTLTPPARYIGDVLEEPNAIAERACMQMAEILAMLAS